MMDFQDKNLPLVSFETLKLMIEKQEVLRALTKLAEEYPGEYIPRSLLREVLLKFMGASALAEFSDHPSVHKLEQTLIKARSVTTS